MRGRAVIEETRHTYDDEGRVAKTRTIRQPEWLREDRLLALALDVYERSLCSDCGHARDRAWHPGMAGSYMVEEVECQACTALNRRAREDAPDGRGLKLYAVDIRPPEIPLPPVERYS